MRAGCEITNQGDPLRPTEPLISPLGSLAGHTSFISSVAFHEGVGGSQYLVSSSWDSTVRMWSLDENRSVWQQTLEGEKLQVVAISPDGEFAIVGAQSNRVRLYRLATGTFIKDFVLAESVWPQSLAWLPTSESFLVGGSDGMVHLLELGTGRETGTFGTLDWPITKVIYSATKEFVLASAGNAVAIWNATSGHLVTKLVDRGVSDGETFWAESLAFSARLDFVVAGSKRTIVVFDSATGEIVQRFVGHGRRILSAEISDDYCRVLSASDDGSLRVWDVKTGQEIERAATAGVIPTSMIPASGGDQFFVALAPLQGTEYNIETWNFRRPNP